MNYYSITIRLKLLPSDPARERPSTASRYLSTVRCEFIMRIPHRGRDVRG